MKTLFSSPFKYKNCLQIIFLFTLTLSLCFVTQIAKADPENCEACFDLPESQIEQCLTDNGCNSAEIPIDNNLWVLILSGLALISYQIYNRVNKSEVVS